MSTRRWFIRNTGITIGGTLAAPLLSERATRAWIAARQSANLRAVEAGRVGVSRGIALPIAIPGVHLEFLRLKMPDGVHLAATLFLPEGASSANRVPAILEILPYRKDDDRLGRDLDLQSFYARNEYAGLRVDVRGTGGSEGTPEDEYSVKEHEDTLLLIDWLSKQPWCSGNIGMNGISYGAFNSVQIAAMNPPALKAIVAAAGTDDRYTDDVHYFGGAMHLFENTWAVAMISSNAMPGAPDYRVDSRSARDRFDAPPWILRWLHQQVDGPYWRRGSLRPDYSRLKIPTFLVGGWLDGYHNFVPRIMKNAPAISKGLIGPWPHSYPDDAHPGPTLDFRGQLLLRWWDLWLKGRDTGILAEPRLSYYRMQWYRPALRLADLESIPGEWRHLNSWPESAFEPTERLFFRSAESSGARSSAAEVGLCGGLSGESARAFSVELRYLPGVGSASKTWAPNGDGSYGLDQRVDDVCGIFFDTNPLREPVDILGFARARIFVSATAPVANWIVRLCDVAPDGTSVYVSKGVLNGTHRKSHTDPEALVPSRIYELEIGLHCTAWRFLPGHRIRVVVSNADWPVVWPSPYPMTTTLYCGGDHPSHIELPIDSSRSLPAPEFRPPPAPAAVADLGYEETPLVWQVTRDEATQSQIFRFERGTKAVIHPLGLTAEDAQVMVAKVADRDPASASLEVKAWYRVTIPGREVEARGEGVLRGTKDQFLCELDCTLQENRKVVRTRAWRDRAPRRLV
jgi:putative CocE/NonD family hydrolase